MSFPGTCDRCDRPALSAAAWWDGGGPGLGEHHTSARCDYHLGNPAGSIPGRCWSCGHPISDAPHISFRDHGVPVIVHIHQGPDRNCRIPGPGWRGPRQCCKCDEPIGYGEPADITEQSAANRELLRTIFSHKTCPKRAFEWPAITSEIARD